MAGFQKILTFVDFSKHSQEVVRYALDIGRDGKASLFFLHVIDERILEAIHAVSRKGYKGDFVNAFRKITRDREADLMQLIPEEQRAAGSEIEFLVRRGEPIEETIGLARELSIDLIVIGNHSEEALGEEFPTGPAQEIINRAPCPVLVIRSVERDFIG